MIAIGLTVLFPGLGHLYLGKTKKGYIFLVLALTPLYPVILLWALIDCHQLEKRIRISKRQRRAGIITIIILIFLAPLVPLIFYLGVRYAIVHYRDHHYYPQGTKREMGEIAEDLTAFYCKNNRYPKSLKEIVKNRPLRKKWLTDEWGQSYRYVAQDHKYELVSAGGDMEFDTKDDIKLHINNRKE